MLIHDHIILLSRKIIYIYQKKNDAQDAVRLVERTKNVQIDFTFSVMDQ